jgi:hypothetical protein
MPTRPPAEPDESANELDTDEVTELDTDAVTEHTHTHDHGDDVDEAAKRSSGFDLDDDRDEHDGR